MKLETYTLFSVLKISEGKKHKCWQQLRLGGGGFMGVLFCVLDFSILPKASTKNTNCFQRNMFWTRAKEIYKSWRDPTDAHAPSPTDLCGLPGGGMGLGGLQASSSPNLPLPAWGEGCQSPSPPFNCSEQILDGREFGLLLASSSREPSLTYASSWPI